MRSWMMGLVTLGAALLGARSAAADEALTLRRALLSSGGVGYFEYEAKVQGSTDLPLDVRLDQVDDVLKSIVVFDDAGSVGSIRLPSRSPAGDVLRDTPFDEQALSSVPALLQALRGAEVRVTAEDETIEGRILSVTEESVELSDHRVITRHRLAILAEGGVRSVLLEEAQIVFTDEQLQGQLEAALASSLQAKERGRRTIMVHTEGQGERLVRVAYVIAVPLWKSTYRIVLPADPLEKKIDVHGWAVVENQSGRAFDGVDLTLVSGNPVTFRQALYKTYWVDRPEIPVEVVGRVLPRLDEGVVSVDEGHRAIHGNAKNGAQPSMAGGYGDMENASPPAAFAPATRVAQGIEATTQVLFHIPTPVTLESGQTALVPIIDRAVTGERVSLYQPETAVKNPLAAVRVSNDTDTGLPPGVVTVYDRSGPGGAVTYVGDARLSTLPAGESRLLAYGVDTKVRIDKRDQPGSIVKQVKISGGVLTIKRSDLVSTTYTIQGAALEPRVVIVEHPRLGLYDLEDQADKLIGMDEGHYRLRVEVPAGKTVELTVTLSRPLGETISLVDLSKQTLLGYASSTDIPAAVRDALKTIAALRATVDEKAAAVTELEAEVTRITTEQARIREDLKVVPAGSPLHDRYLGELGAQEDRLSEIQTELRAARQAQLDAKRALETAVRELQI